MIDAHRDLAALNRHNLHIELLTANFDFRRSVIHDNQRAFSGEHIHHEVTLSANELSIVDRNNRTATTSFDCVDFIRESLDELLNQCLFAGGQLG
jgi:hypothetical protein